MYAINKNDNHETFHHAFNFHSHDSYFVEFSYDPTCNYYERGKYGCRNFHDNKLPLVMLRLLLFLSASLHMLVFACLDFFFCL